MTGAAWFSVQVRVVCLVEPDGATMQDDCVHVFRAEDFDDAFVRALALGRDHEQEYRNADGERVRLAFERVVTLDALAEADLDGVEVHSTRSEISGGAPFDTVFRPEDHTPTASGVPFRSST